MNPLEHPDWDATLARRPDFSFFQGAAWSRVLAATYGFTPCWLESGGAWLPLMEVDSWLTGRRAVSLPFTDFCPPLAASAAEFRALFEQALARGRERRWRSLELRGGRDFLAEAPASLAFWGHRLELTGDEGRLFAKMEGPARQAVRKAEKDGVRAEVLQSLEGMKEFYRLQCLTRKRHGLPPQPARFFVNIWKHVLSQNQGMVVLARWGSRAVAGAVFLHLGGRAIYKFGASELRWQQLRPNNLVMWTGMKWLAGRGVGTLHLGRTSRGNEGLRRFKLSLGAVEEPLEYVKFNLRKRGFEVETDPVAGWHNRIFRLLPLPLSRRAGEWLYRHWA